MNPARSARARTALLLGPGVVLLGCAFFAPMAILLDYSFDRFIPGGSQQPAFVFDNYLRFLSDQYYAAILLRTLALGLGVTLLSLILAFPLAYTIARSRSRWRSVLLLVVLIPLMTSVVVRSYGWTVLLANGGIVNSVLTWLGIGPFRLLFTMTGVVVSLAEVLMPVMVLSISGVLQTVSPDLEEAARSLGAGRIATFRDVILPLSLPGVAAGSLLVFALSVSAFATPRLIGGPSVQVMATTVYDQALSALNWPFASATSIIMLIVVLCLTVAQDRLLRLRRQR